MSTPSTPGGGPAPAPGAAPAAAPVPAAAPGVPPPIRRRGAAHGPVMPGHGPAAAPHGAPAAAPAVASVLHRIGSLLSSTKAKIAVVIAGLGLIGVCAGPSVISGTGDFFRKRSKEKEAAAERLITPRENLSLSAVAQLVGDYRLRLTEIPNTVDSDGRVEEHPFEIEVIDVEQAGPGVVSGAARITVNAHGKATVYESTEPVSADRTARPITIPMGQKN